MDERGELRSLLLHGNAGGAFIFGGRSIRDAAEDRSSWSTGSGWDIFISSFTFVG
jgi:hypothetical protein